MEMIADAGITPIGATPSGKTQSQMQSSAGRSMGVPSSTGTSTVSRQQPLLYKKCKWPKAGRARLMVQYRVT